jgi:hypothetical protein
MPRGSTAFGWVLAGACMTAALVAGAAAEARATRDAPPPGHTGGFDEPTCQECHFEAEVNAGGGRLRLEGVPEAYRPGGAYRLTVTLVQEGLKAGGFQLTARTDGGAQAGTIAGVEMPERRVGVTVSGDVAYAHHILAGVDPVSTDTARWTLVWTAPGHGGTVLFHVAANAANDDSSPLGDYVYTVESRVGSASKD